MVVLPAAGTQLSALAALVSLCSSQHTSIVAFQKTTTSILCLLWTAFNIPEALPLGRKTPSVLLSKHSFPSVLLTGRPQPLGIGNGRAQNINKLQGALGLSGVKKNNLCLAILENE